eukprot:CAMPEP_0118701262 /NCGR_PEP_ID=MMETSP0800-20121206/17139_1 /TAXON_ID=210618 ORGANISM="Striatella unipunctata, Strain CCMP2910" /NCGR_SAMPLE_ID=MMETSP0800 /ASSEMBLY_ACC=CAM_ASM_000638 /LENGTH=144 /DNA_ID=CAMNT_0006602135 /DNA_START=171 /DNA_END=605 /DNA_ORIENTATION=+
MSSGSIINDVRHSLLRGQASGDVDDTSIRFSIRQQREEATEQQVLQDEANNDYSGIPYCTIFQSALANMDKGVDVPSQYEPFLCQQRQGDCTTSSDQLAALNLLCKRLVGPLDIFGTYITGTELTCSEACVLYNTLYCSGCDIL